MRMFTRTIICLVFCFMNVALFAQCEVKISSKTCKGTVLTANADKNSLMKLDWQLDGKTVATFGSPLLGVTVAGGNGEGNADDQLNEPNGVFVDVHGNLWIADTKNARIQKFKPGSTKGITVGANLPNAPTFPTTLFVTGKGAVYVADYFESRVKLLIKGGTEWIDVAGRNNELHLTRGVWVDRFGNVYVTDIGNNRVVKYKPNSSVGKTVAGGNGYGSALNQLAKPTSVVGDPDGNLYINDQDNQRVVKWAPGAKSGVIVAGNGASFDIVPPSGSKNPIYASATTTSSLTGKVQTVLYVSDKAKNDVEMWPEGASSGTVVAGGNGRGDLSCQLNRPFANYVCGNYLYVADRDNARIQRFDLSGNFNTEFTATKSGSYSVVATFSDGHRVRSNSVQVTSGCEETSLVSANSSSDAQSIQISSKAFAYPNPARTFVTINFSSEQNGKYIFELSELSGKTLLHKEVNGSGGLNNTTLDVSSFAKGIYVITVIGPDKMKQSIKLNKE